jgi:hypothetical protein
MSVAPVIGYIHRLSVHVEAVAALGAASRLQRSGAEAESQLQSRSARRNPCSLTALRACRCPAKLQEHASDHPGDPVGDAAVLFQYATRQ